MRGAFSSKAWSRLARIVALGAGALALAGCATGYAFVQPDVAGGGYYTSDGPYPGQGYYDDYGTGPYYPGTSGYGYYSGTWPDAYPFGWYGGYGNYGYWPSFTFNLGYSNAWNFPGYWGPWYAGGRGCARWGCGHHRHGHRHHDDHDPVVSGSPRPWLKPDHPPVPPGARGTGPDVRAPAQPVERFVNRRPLPSARFAPHDFARVPANRIRTVPNMPADVVAMPRVPAETGFANRRPLAVPAARPDFRPPVPAVSRPAPRMAVDPELVNRRPMAMPDRPAFRAPVPVPRAAPAGLRPVQSTPVPATRSRAATKVEIPRGP
jgi:hypothetical protein